MLKTLRNSATTPDKLIFQNLPISLDATANQYALVYGSDGNIYTSDGANWNVASTSGTQGIQGIQGRQGIPVRVLG